jgi:hypothetical protein
LTVRLTTLGEALREAQAVEEQGARAWMDPFDPAVTVDRLYAAWQRAEKRAREVPPDSPEAAERLIGAEEIWKGYEQALAKAIGRGSFRLARA